MLMAVFALFSVAGAWLAWRRNPSYSGGFTLRVLLVTALAIAAVVLLIVAAVDLTSDRSEPVVIGTMFVVVTGGTLALIFIIQRVSTPPAARLNDELPPSVEALHVHRSKVGAWARALAVLAAGSGLLGLLVPGNFGVMFYVVAAMTLFLSLILLPVMYVTARRFDRALTALEAAPWVHWRYTPEQWRQWVEAQFARASTAPPTFTLQRDWRKLALPLGAIAVGVYAFTPGSWLWKTLYILATCGAIAGIVFAASWDERRAPARLRARRLTAPAEAYFGRDGVYCDGVFTTWLGLDTYLTSAGIDRAEPPSLLLCFEKIVVNPYGPSRPMAIHQSVLIPPGAEADVARLQTELAARCTQARVALSPAA
jgi:hypothetical protein